MVNHWSFTMFIQQFIHRNQKCFSNKLETHGMKNILVALRMIQLHLSYVNEKKKTSRTGIRKKRWAYVNMHDRMCMRLKETNSIEISNIKFQINTENAIHNLNWFINLNCCRNVIFRLNVSWSYTYRFIYRYSSQCTVGCKLISNSVYVCLQSLRISFEGKRSI